MHPDIVTVVYTVAQFICMLAVWPVLRKVYLSETADAISVPAVGWYVVNGFIVSAYMVVCGCHWAATTITFVELVVVNVALFALAYSKQKKAR